MAFHIDPAELHGLADRITTIGSSLDVAAPTGGDVDGVSVGTDDLGAAIGEVTRLSVDRMEATGLYVTEAGQYLASVADAAEALDRAMAGIRSFW